MLSVNTHRLLVAAFVTAGSFGVNPATAAEPVQVKAPAPVKEKDAGPVDEKEVRALLKEKPKFDADGLPVSEFFAQISKSHGLTVRFDLAAFKRMNPAQAGGMALAAGGGTVLVALRAEVPADEIQLLYNVKIRMPLLAGITLADVLTDLCSQLPGKCAYRIRHNQVLIGPAYLPPVTPGAGANSGEVSPFVQQYVLAEQLLGESVSVAIDDRPLTEAIQELRKITGANIVLDARAKDKAKQVVSGTFDDTRLLTVLELLADMCELKVVSNNNVFYVTSVDNAVKMQKRVHRDLFGEPPAPMAVPPGAFGLGGFPPPAKDEPKK